MFLNIMSFIVIPSINIHLYLILSLHPPVLCSPLQSEDANVTLIIYPCRPGYSLRKGESGLAICVCVGAEENPFAVLSCDNEDNTILLRVTLLL